MTDNKITKQPYDKPKLRTIELEAKDVLLGTGCFSTSSGSSTAGCGLPPPINVCANP